MNRRVIAFMLVLAMSLTLWGCTSQKAAETASPTAPAETAPAPAAFPVTVTDAAGRKVTIEEAPQTLVSGYYIASSMLIALGQADKLVGIEAKADTRPVYRLAAPQLLELPSVGTAKELSLEECAALNPDLIILPLSLKDSVPALEELGLSVILVKPESLELLRETIMLLGAATGAFERAEALLDYSLETEALLEVMLADVERPLVYLAGNSSYLNTAGSAMYQNTLIEMGGGINVAAELGDSYWVEVSYEQLLAWNPEIIVIAPGAKYTREDILTDAQLSALDAVQNERIYTMPTGLESWDSPVPSAAVGSRWMASALHPDSYAFDVFSDDVTQFYRDFYGFEVDSALLTR